MTNRDQIVRLMEAEMERAEADARVKAAQVAGPIDVVGSARARTASDFAEGYRAALARMKGLFALDG